MSAGGPKKMAKALARPIKTKRDYHEAASVANKTLQQSAREPVAERRLQALLDEIEKFDNEDEDAGSDDATEELESVPRRRWSDEPSDAE